MLTIFIFQICRFTDYTQIIYSIPIYDTETAVGLFSLSRRACRGPPRKHYTRVATDAPYRARARSAQRARVSGKLVAAARTDSTHITASPPGAHRTITPTWCVGVLDRQRTHVNVDVDAATSHHATTCMTSEIGWHHAAHPENAVALGITGNIARGMPAAKNSWWETATCERMTACCSSRPCTAFAHGLLGFLRSTSSRAVASVRCFDGFIPERKTSSTRGRISRKRAKCAAGTCSSLESCAHTAVPDRTALLSNKASSPNHGDRLVGIT